MMKVFVAIVVCMFVLGAQAGDRKTGHSHGGKKGHQGHPRGMAMMWSSFHGRPGSQLDHLFEDLFHHYHKNVRPCTDPGCSDSISVSVGISPINFDMNFEGKELRTHGWTRMQWTDERLRWDPEDYGGISNIRVPQNKLWIPDIYLYNRFEHVSQEQFWNQEVLAVVYNTGSVLFIPPSVLSSYCDFNKTESTQSCILKFGSWTYSKNDISLVGGHHFKGCDTNDYKGTILDGWKFKSCSGVIQDKFYQCCPDESYPSLTINVNFEKGGSRAEELQNARSNDGQTVVEEPEPAPAESFFF